MIEQTAPDNLELSVVVAIVSDIMHLEGCLDALAQQTEPPTMEVIVPYLSDEHDTDPLQARFPQIRFHSVDPSDLGLEPGATRDTINELRALGVAQANGRIVALLEDHGRADRNWAREVVKAHKSPIAAVGGAIENEVDRPMNWAIYFCDFGRYQRPFQGQTSAYLSDAHVSYKRDALESIRAVWQDAFHEPTVNGSLMAAGETLWLSPTMVVNQHRQNLRLLPMLGERYIWGRRYSKNRAIRDIGSGSRLLYLLLAPALPFLLMARKTRDVLTKRKFVKAFLTASPLTFLLLVFWSLGEFVGYLTARPNRS